MGTGVWLAVVLGPLPAFIAVWLILSTWRQVRRERRRVVDVAAQRGWSHARTDHAVGRRFTGPPFGSGPDRYCTDVITGVLDGWSFTSFGSLRSATDQMDTTEITWNVLVEAPPAGLPVIQCLDYSRWSHQIPSFRRWVSGDADFDSRFSVTSAPHDDGVLRRVFNEPVRNLAKELSDRWDSDFSWRIEAGALRTWRIKPPLQMLAISPDRLEAIARALIELVERALVPLAEVETDQTTQKRS